MAPWADVIVEFINLLNDEISNELELSYHDGACKDIDSNFFIHLSEIPNT